jgi:tetratricopeptide (TPR) repeat protein
MLELAKLNPEDPFLQQAYKDTAAKATIYRGNYEKRSDGQGVGDDDDSRADYTSEDVLEEKIYAMEERLQDEPENFKLAVDIAKLYVERHDFDRAFEYFDFVQENHSVSDSSIDRALADAHEARFNYDISQYPEGSPERVGLEAERDAFMLENCRDRADRYPTMLEFRFELGERLFRTGDVSEAIQTFQRTQNSPPHKLRSLFYLGQCFMQRSMYDMAASQFEKAMEGKSAFDEQKKEIVYFLASVYEKQGKHEQAAAHFKSIYEMDIRYRDVAEKVEGGYTGDSGV